MLITALGDTALRVQVGEKIDEATLARVGAACAAIEAASLPGVRELVPAYTTVTVHYDPIAVAASGEAADDPAGWLMTRVKEAVAGAGKIKPAKPREVTIPVCYGGEFGPDLARVAAQAKMSPEEVVRLHGKGDYAVALVGFSPGFPYLVGLPKQLATPRLAKPRTLVPAGSVGIAGAQTGIYSLATPGGWNLIGRAAVRLFDARVEPPALLRAGDRVKFREVTREEFARIEEGRA